MSVGGSSVLLATSKEPNEIDAVISLNPFSSPFKLFIHAIHSTVSFNL